MTADLARLLQGTLLTRDFLIDGIRKSAEYAALNDKALRASRDKLVALYQAFPVARSPNESQTEDDLIWPILQTLGWSSSLRQQNLAVKGRDDVPDGLLFADDAEKAKANSHGEEWRRYGFGLAILESKRWLRPLDRRSNRKGEETAPSTQMLRYLRRVDVVTEGGLRWGILTNGAKWRLYFQGAKSVSEEFCEIDLHVALGLAGDAGGLFDLTDEERDHWLRVFLLVFSRTSFLPSKAEKTTFLQRALDEGRFYEERVAKSLADLVFNQAFPALARGIAQSAPEADLQSVRAAALVLLYRLLFLLYAEDRDLLPVRDKRFDDYSLRGRVREDVGRRKQANDTFSTSATKYWSAIDDLCRAIDQGDGSIGLPPYNGGLFDVARTPLLSQVRLADDVIADVIDVLSFDHSGPLRRYINYRDLSVQQLGSIYERLLEFELIRAGEGGIEVRPNIFARKRSGSYYTSEELVRVILDETLEPLIAERMSAFQVRSDELAKASGAEDQRIAQLKRLDPAEALLELRICDPAMGSGHFLVSLVDTLTDQIINAIAEAAEVVDWSEYQSPLINRIDAIRTTIVGNAEEKGWGIDISQLDDRHIIRRMVLKRCIYGVDKNPMAVELAKVSLWLHTFTVGAPLSFLDHHLRCGDSLFGLTVHSTIERVQKKWGAALLLHDALQRAMGSASAMQAIERLTDAEIAEAHRSAQIWDGIVSMVQPLDAFMTLIHALDWLDIRENGGRTAVQSFLDGLYGDPFEIARGKIDIDATKSKARDFLEIFDRARALIAEERFLNWQTAFPGVWEGWETDKPVGGFDAVIGNPPWDRIKLQQIEWFAARRPEISMAQRASERTQMIATLKTDGDPLWEDFKHAEQRAIDTARMARKSGDYPLLSGGDTNLNSLFVERAHALVKPGGMVGLLIPSGLASDQSSAEFFRKVTGEKRVHCIVDFFNRRYDGTLFFPDVYYRFKFCAYVAGGADRTFDNASYGFFIRDVAEISDPDRVFPVTAEEIIRINPNSGTAPIFRSRRDKDITFRVYSRLPIVLNRASGEANAIWPVRYVRMLDMANDSERFRTRAELEGKEAAWHTGANGFQSGAGEWVPLYEGKMVQAFDHRASDIVLAKANVFRPGQGADLSGDDHRNPARQPTPRYWVKFSESGWDAETAWCLSLKDVTSVTNARTTIAAIIPRFGAGHTLPVLFPKKGEGGPGYVESAPLVLANLNTVILDYLARQKVHGNHLAWYLLEQLPVVPIEEFAQTKFGSKTAGQIVREAALELTYTAHDIAAFAKDMGYVDAKGTVKPPFVWDDERRLKLRAKLDAIFFHLYGVTDRDDVRYIYSTFPIVEREETATFGSYRSRELCLAYMNALAAGQPDADVRI